MALKRTYIAFILDQSKSMERIKKSVIKGFNEKAEAIRKDAEQDNDKVETLVSFYTFNHNVNNVYQNVSVNFLQDLTESEYKIEGDTAMYDAVGQAINDMKTTTDPNDENNAYLFIIVSDGAERCSRTFTRAALADKIKECQDTGRWTFTYIGANQDLAKVAKDLNIPIGNFAKYSADAANTYEAMGASASNVGKFLKARKYGGQSATKCFQSESGGMADHTNDGVSQRIKTLGFPKSNCSGQRNEQNMGVAPPKPKV